MKNIIFIAPPAAGKGTQSDLLQEKYDYVHISTGEIFRDIIAEDSDLGKRVKNIIAKGQLVTDDIMISLIKEKLSSIKGKPFILDGFPRTLNQAIVLDEMLEGQKCDNYITIYLALDEEKALQRVLGRLTCICGSTYNIYDDKLKPQLEGICDRCGNNLIKRDDDNESAFKTRFKTFLDNNEGLINYYAQKNKLVIVNVDREVKDIFEDISKEISK